MYAHAQLVEVPHELLWDPFLLRWVRVHVSTAKNAARSAPEPKQGMFPVPATLACPAIARPAPFACSTTSSFTVLVRLRTGYTCARGSPPEALPSRKGLKVRSSCSTAGQPRVRCAVPRTDFARAP